MHPLNDEAKHPHREFLLFAGTCLLFAFAKIWLVHGEEIIARDVSHDQRRFAEMAQSLIRHHWLGGYNEKTLIREVAYPLWLWFAHLTGIPLRIAIEILLACGAFAFTDALRRLRLPFGLVVMAYLVLLFQPYSLYWNKELRAETFYAPMLFLALGATIRALSEMRRSRRILWVLLSGIPLALAWHTRPETELILVYLVVFAAIEIARGHRRGERWVTVLGVTGLLTLLPSSIIVASTLAIRALNYSHYGVSVTTELTAPGFVAAFGALSRVRPDRPRLHVGLPADARQKAYAASPAFRELEPFLERGEIGERWKSGGHWVGVTDDFADGWFMWGMREAVAAAGHCHSAPEADAFYRRIADEINAACDDGKLATRMVLLPMLNPDLSTYLPQLPRALLRVVHFYFGQPPSLDVDELLDTTPEVRKLFDEVANRRVGEDAEPGRAQRAIEDFLRWANLRATRALTVLGLVAAVVLLVAGRGRPRLSPGLAPVMVLLVSVLVSRILLFALLDASSFSGRLTRYSYPVMGIEVCIMLILVQQAVRLLRERRRERRSSVPATS